MNNDIVNALNNFGYLDIDRCNKLMDEAGVLDSEVADYIKEWNDGAPLLDIDIVAITYDYILMMVRQEIDQATGKDIINDLDQNINVHANYCASSFDYTEKAKEEALELARMVEEPSNTLQWFIREIE